MKKRILIPLAIFLGCIAMMLVFTIFQLYKEAEKVQRSIFVNEVLVAGEQVIDKIDATLKNDTIALSAIHQVNPDSIPFSSVYKKYSNKFLLDSATQRPIGIINTTFDFDQDNTIYAIIDTIYFDTSYLPSLENIQEDWDNNPNSPQLNRRLSSNLVEMDSNDVALLNHKYLEQLIKEALSDANISNSFDFALYNAYTAHFIVEPALTGKEEILQSEYVFRLKANDKFIAPHYLIIYFPEERSIFFQRMGTMMLLIVSFILIIMIITGITLGSLYRQKRIADVKNDFINNMTHEFKTPISTISLACEAMSDPSINDMDVKIAYVSIIQDENNRLKKMVENILQLAQLNKGQLRMNIERFDVHELINKIINSISLQVANNQGHINSNLNAGEAHIFGDRSHIENIISNLIENAIKYSPENPEIEVRTHNEGKMLIIEIEDHGVGISGKNCKRIFQDFYRVSKGNIHDTKGYGLGLGYVKKIVSLHNGNINVKSELGKGSTFIVSLPTKN